MMSGVWQRGLFPFRTELGRVGSKSQSRSYNHLFRNIRCAEMFGFTPLHTAASRLARHTRTACVVHFRCQEREKLLRSL